jgi:hypothetical protein
MDRVPDWAGTKPRSVEEWRSRLPARTRNSLADVDIKSLEDARQLMCDVSKDLWYETTSRVKGLGKLSIKHMEMALGIFSPEWSSLDTTGCWMCHGKNGIYPDYCSKHSARLNEMKGSWRKFISPLDKKGNQLEVWQREITQKAIRRWLKMHSPTIMNKKDAEHWCKKFDALIKSKQRKRWVYAIHNHPGCYFYEGSATKVGEVWIDGHLVKILPVGTLETMNKMRNVVEKMEKST